MITGYLLGFGEMVHTSTYIKHTENTFDFAIAYKIQLNIEGWTVNEIFMQDVSGIHSDGNWNFVDDLKCLKTWKSHLILL